jgi:ATP-dependent DNA helicase RecG
LERLDKPLSAEPQRLSTTLRQSPKRPTAKRKSQATAERSLDSPVTVLKGVSTVTAGRLTRLGVKTVMDLLYLMPRRHDDYSRAAKVSDLKPGLEQTIVANVWEVRRVQLGMRQATQATIGDETGNIRAIWWFWQPYFVKSLSTDSKVVFSGRVEWFRGRLQFESPEFEILDKSESLLHTGRLVPVYPLTEGLTSRVVRRIMWRTLEEWLPEARDILPDEMRKRLGLLPIGEALGQVHFPQDIPSWEQARRRLAFEELLVLQLAVLSRRGEWESESGIVLKPETPVVESFARALPFALTGAQKRVLSEIASDLGRGTPPMNRLLQGDVGSGKTVVALAALLTAAAAGHQGAMMAPTELLAEQHFLTASRLLKPFAHPVETDTLLSTYIEPHPNPITVGLLVGRMSRKEKEEMQWRARERAVDILIGTHTLIQEMVDLPRLALAVVDEQHRFGVLQRALLRERGEVHPHVLVMSATPIPRTLALTLYGDLDISILDELPLGRIKITTKWVPPDKRDAAYGFVRKQVQQGRQAFVICPLIEESEAIEARAATEEYERLSRDVFPDLRVGLVHGRMPSAEKDAAMTRFRDGQTDILVSTPVVEVGIDVPNASVMLIEAADRFGLAQLHQFRGRVGRGAHASYCLLLADSPSEDARERLSILERTTDGFELAEADLRIRGPGDFFGTRQSGLPELRVAGLGDRDLLIKTRQEAERILTLDPTLERAEDAALAKEVSRFLGNVTRETS